MSRQQFREFIHAVKRANQMGPKDNIWMDAEGFLYRKSGEGLMNLGNAVDLFTNGI